MLSEAHLSARIQKDAMSFDLTGSSTGTPDLIRLDQKVASSIQTLVKDSLSLDFLGLQQQQQAFNSKKEILNEDFRDSICFALREVSNVLTRSSPLFKSLRKKSSIPSTVQSVCDLLQQVDFIMNRINDKLIHSIKITAIIEREQETLTTTNVIIKSAVTAAEKLPKKANQIELQQLQVENDQLNKQLSRMKDREGVLLRRVRDLEIDCRVKAHVVSETVSSAQAIFDENSILRQIAEHNSSLLLEVDALSRCVAENDTLHSEIAAKQKVIDSMEEKEGKKR